MNIFVLDRIPVKAAQYYCDKHVVKIILEIVEMMGYTYPEKEFRPLTWLKYHGPHFNHPMSKWVRACLSNFDWALQHATALCDEYTYRYGKIHAYRKHIDWIALNPPLVNLPVMSMTDWPRCFGAWKDKIELSDDAVYDYRRYYILAKRFATWKNRPIPEWFR